jgi:prepilin-type N-terminal cleavage/methylation domain-containing protein
MSKRAFTLIELLVVIAIIAILAAILFPVFAQAKEAAKQASRLSAMKQTGTGSAVYLADSDDTFPICYAANSVGAQPAYWWNYSATVPAGWATPASGYLENEDISQFANSVYPYIKNRDLYDQPGGTVWETGLTPQAGRKPSKVNGTVNGLISEYNMSAVAAPSRLPLIWQPWGAGTDNGMAYTNPRLTCSAAGVACRFNPGGHPQGVATTVGSQYVYDDTIPAWSFKQGSIFVFSDTSAKFVTFGRGNGSLNSVAPFRNLSAQGKYVFGTTSLLTYASPGSTVQYHANFRPDNEFNN